MRLLFFVLSTHYGNMSMTRTCAENEGSCHVLRNLFKKLRQVVNRRHQRPAAYLFRPSGTSCASTLNRSPERQCTIRPHHLACRVCLRILHYLSLCLSVIGANLQILGAHFQDKPGYLATCPRLCPRGTPGFNWATSDSCGLYRQKTRIQAGFRGVCGIFRTTSNS